MSAEPVTNPDAERSVLGAVLLDAAVLDAVELQPADFADACRSEIWAAMQSLRKRGEAVDAVTVPAEVWRRIGRDDVTTVHELQDCVQCVPTAANAAYYADLVASTAISRRVLDACKRAPQELACGVTGEDLLESMLGELSRIRGARAVEATTLAEVTSDEAKRFREDRELGRVPGIPTGIPSLDRITAGLPRGVPTVLGARPGLGKSSLALHFADHVSAAGRGVHLFTAEDRAGGWGRRALARASGVATTAIRSRSVDAADVLDRAAQHYADRDSCVIEHAHGRTASWITRRARAMRGQLNTELVIVDYVQLLAPPDRGRSPREGIDASMSAFAQLAGELDVAVLVLSQLNRESVKERRDPEQRDFRESGGIEQAAKLLLALTDREPDGGELSDDLVRILVLKNHDGPTGEVVAMFDRARCRFA